MNIELNLAEVVDPDAYLSDNGKDSDRYWVVVPKINPEVSRVVAEDYVVGLLARDEQTVLQHNYFWPVDSIALSDEARIPLPNIECSIPMILVRHTMAADSSPRWATLLGEQWLMFDTDGGFRASVKDISLYDIISNIHNDLSLERAFDYDQAHAAVNT